MNHKAVSYVRVSSREQHDQGYSPMAQKRLLWEFARNNDFDIVKEYEEAETAKESGRKSFNAMLDFVKKKGIKHILVEKTDRLHRNFRDFNIIEDLINDYDVTVYFVKEGQSIGKTASSNAKFIYGIKTLVAKNFIDNLKEEVQKGIQEKLRLGEYPSKAPLGYINTKDPITKKSIIIPDPDNKLLIVTLFGEYSEGIYSLKSVIDYLEQNGFANNLPIGRNALNKSVVAKILQNPFYIGKFVWKGQMYDGVHEPIIDVDIWNAVQQVLNGKNVNKCKKHNSKLFIYKGLFICGECQRSITAEIKKQKYTYYRCTKFETNCTQKPVREKDIDTEVEKLLKKLKISDNGVEYVVTGLKQSLQVKRDTHDKDYEMLVREHSMLKNRIDKMYEDKLDGKITDELYESKFTDYTNRLSDLEERIANHNNADINYYDFGHKILELAKNAEKLYKSANPDEKRELLGFLLSNSKLLNSKPEFALKQPFNLIAKHSPNDECSAWQGRQESNPR